MKYNLERFTTAQKQSYKQALEELNCGKKTTHWIWYIFPQIRGLGYSEMAKHYALSGIGEAKVYLAHPILGKRMIEVCDALLQHQDKPILDILGRPDNMKLKSCMTLFLKASGGETVFQDVLNAFFEGELDKRTLALL